ncbi:hypothetical protein EDB19DRAFT_1954362 [Suillus lakei]|nr:hypothetical protein EDB19DRAFT_1954362 [Suillus lakei]
MKCALRVAYSNSDSQSEEDKDAKAEATTNCAVSESTIVVHVQADVSEGGVLHDGVPAGDTQEEELAPAVMPSIPNQAPDVPHIPIQQPDVPHIPIQQPDVPHIPIPQPDVPRPQAPHDSEPLCDGPHPQIPCGSEPLCDPPRNLDDIPHDDNRDPGEPLYNHHEHSRNPCAPLQYPHEPLQHDPHGALHDPRDDIQQDHYPSHGNYCDPLHPYNQRYHGHPREVQNQRKAAPIIDRDSLHPHNAFYPHNSHHTRYLGGPPDNYGSTDVHAETRDSSPTSDSLGHFSHGEQEHPYPSRYSPVFDPGYTHEAGYSRHDDPDECGQLLAPYHPVGAYRNGGYPQDRRYYDSRWTDREDPYVCDAVPRSNSDATNHT